MIETIPVPIENSILLRNFVDSVESPCIFLLVTSLAFNSNGASEGKDFLGKYFSIGFVVGTRLIPLGVGLFVMYAFLHGFCTLSEKEDILTIDI